MNEKNPWQYLPPAFLRGQMWGVNSETKMLIAIFHFTLTKCKAEVSSLCTLLPDGLPSSHVKYAKECPIPIWCPEGTLERESSCFKDIQPVGGRIEHQSRFCWTQALGLLTLSGLTLVKSSRLKVKNVDSQAPPLNFPVQVSRQPPGGNCAFRWFHYGDKFGKQWMRLVFLKL